MNAVKSYYCICNCWQHPLGYFDKLIKGFFNFVITSRKMSHLITSSKNRSIKHVFDFMKAIKCDEQMTASYSQGHTFMFYMLSFIYLCSMNVSSISVNKEFKYILFIVGKYSENVLTIVTVIIFTPHILIFYRHDLCVDIV